MRELSQEAQSILTAARSAHDPTNHDRARLRGAMVAQLGAAAVISSSATLAAASGSGVVGVLGALKIIGAVAALTAVVGTTAWQVTRSPSQLANKGAQHVQVAQPKAMMAAPGTSIDQNKSPEPPAVRLTPSNSAGSQAVPAVHAQAAMRAAQKTVVDTDALTEQVNILAAVRGDLRQGNAERALVVLNDSASLFDKGSLREEYLGARVLVLRALGRGSDASLAAERFREEMPRSVLASKLTEPPHAKVDE